MCSQMDSSVSG